MIVNSRGEPFRAGSNLPVRQELGTATNDQEALVHLASALVGRSRMAQKAGFQYGNKRDIFAVAGYPSDANLGYEQFYALYKRGDIAGRIVDMPPSTTWKKPPEVSVEGVESSNFVDDFENLAKRLRLWNRLERVDRLSGIGRYGVLLIGVSGDDVELRQPLETVASPEDIVYLSAYPEEDAHIEVWDTSPFSPRFGHPELYKLSLSSGVPGFSTPDVLVHHSRVIHIAEDLLTDDVFGRPRLERVYNRLMDLEKVTASTGEAYWQLAVRILTGRLDAEAEISEKDLDSMRDAMEEIVHDLRRQFLGAGAELEWLQSSPPDPKSAADMYMFLIAAAAGIPKRILFGTETGERASTQDERQWLGTIAERQERFAEPMILRAFIDRMIGVGAISPPEGENGYEVYWPALYQASDQEKADTNKATAEVAKALTPLGGDPSNLVTITDDGDVYLRSSEVLEKEGVKKPTAPKLEADPDPDPEELEEQGMAPALGDGEEAAA